MIQQNHTQLIRNFFTVSGLTLLSRVTGFVRDILTAALLGTSMGASAFFVALKFPNFFRRITAEGAFQSSFIPVCTSVLQRDGQAAALRFTVQIIGYMVMVLVPFVVLMIWAMPWCMAILVPGFVEEPEQLRLTVALSHITFPYLLTISLVALLGALLNIWGRFVFFAGMPIVFNLVLTVTLLVCLWQNLPPTYTLAVSVLFAGVVQLLFMLWGLWRSNITLPLTGIGWTSDVKRVFHLMGPGLLSAGVLQISVFVDVFLASLVSTHAIAYLYYAERFYQLPVGMIGVAMGISLLPLLSHYASVGNKEQLCSTLRRGLEWSFLLSIPATVALIILAHPLISIVYERGAFDTHSTRASALALQAYALGIPAYVGVKVLQTSYFAQQDMVSPVRIVMGMTLCHVVLAYFLLQWFDHVGIALATAVTFWLHGLLLFWGLYHKQGLRIDQRLRRYTLRILLSSGLMGIFVSLLLYLFDAWLLGSFLQRLSGFLVIVLGGFVVYGVLSVLLGIFSLRDWRLLLSRPSTLGQEQGSDKGEV